jgi:predicted nucleic acid-binding protein
MKGKRVFVDSNIWIYLYSNDDALAKKLVMPLDVKIGQI